jgi:hypothetical protein
MVRMALAGNRLESKKVVDVNFHINTTFRIVSTEELEMVPRTDTD